MNLQKIGAFFKSYLFIRILLNALFLYIWIDGTVDNFNQSKVNTHDRSLLLFHTVIYNISLLSTLYINTLVFIPTLLLRKKYLGYAACLLASIVFHTAILVFYREYIVDHIPNVGAHDFSGYSAFTRQTRERTLNFFFYIFYSASSLTVILFSLVFLGQHFFIVIRQNELIRQQQTEIELSVLKSQINPHFLFNVLNSIYSLSLKKSDQAPEIVMRLSEMLRYMLYEARHEYVPLKKELQMLRDYADIEQMRLGKKQVLHLHGEEDPLSPYRIAPLLLIPFVENAVKHGVNSMAEGAYVFVEIKMEDHTLYFTCKNNYKPLPSHEEGGLGLENVRKRLQLLYPGKHALDIKRQNDTFEVLLSIQLNL